MTKPMSLGAQRGQYLVRYYDREAGSVTKMLADIAEYCDHVGFNFMGAASTARQIADHRTKE